MKSILIAVLIFLLPSIIFAQFSFVNTWRAKAIEELVVHDIIDVDQDGIDEVVSIGSGGPSMIFWTIRKSDTTDLSLIDQYISTVYTNTSSIYSVNKSNTATKYILVATPLTGTDYRYELVNLTNYEKTVFMNSGGKLGIADFGNNGKDDLFIKSDTEVKVYSLPEFDLLSSIPIHNDGFGDMVYFENIDNDTDIEIIFVSYDNNGFFVIVDLVNGAYERSWIQFQGIRAVDFHEYGNVGYKQITSLVRNFSSPDSVFIFDYENESNTFKGTCGTDTVPFPTSFLQMDVNDLDKDGSPEFIFANSMRLLVSSSQDLSTLFIDECLPSAIDATLKTANFSHTKNKALLYGGTCSTLLQTYRHPEEKWVSTCTQNLPFDYIPPILADDLDNDGQDEIVQYFGRSATYCLPATGVLQDRGALTLTDVATKIVKYKSNFAADAVPGYIFQPQPRDMLVENLDDDPQKEILYCNQRDIILYDYIAQEGGILASFDTLGVYITTMEYVDIDLDGIKEIVVAFDTYGASNDGYTFVYVLDIAGNVIWESPHLGVFDIYSSNYFFRIGNIDDDPQPEIIVGTHDFVDYLHIIDGVTKEIKTGIPPYTHYAIEIHDFNLDGVNDIMLGGVGNISIVDHNFNEIITKPVLEGLIHNLKKYDFDHNGLSEFMIVQNGRIKVLSNDLETILWESDFLSPRAGFSNAVTIHESAGIPAIYIMTDFTYEEYTFTALDQTENPATDVERFALYPNPAREQIVIFSEQWPNHNFYIQIYDVSGKAIKAASFTDAPTDDQFTFTVSDLPPGFYTCTIQDKTSRQSHNLKFIITR